MENEFDYIRVNLAVWVWRKHCIAGLVWHVGVSLQKLACASARDSWPSFLSVKVSGRITVCTVQPVCACTVRVCELCNGKGRGDCERSSVCLLSSDRCLLARPCTSCFALCTLPPSPLSLSPEGMKSNWLLENTVTCAKTERHEHYCHLPSPTLSSGVLWVVSHEWAARGAANPPLCTLHSVIKLFIARWPCLAATRSLSLRSTAISPSLRIGSVRTCSLAAAQWWKAGVELKTLESAWGHKHIVMSLFLWKSPENLLALLCVKLINGLDSLAWLFYNWLKCLSLNENT